MVSGKESLQAWAHKHHYTYPTGMVQTDDRQALLEIARQLNVSHDDDEQTSVSAHNQFQLMQQSKF